MALTHAIKYRETEGAFWVAFNGETVVPILNFKDFCRKQNLSRSHLYLTAKKTHWKCKGWYVRKVLFQDFYRKLKDGLYSMCHSAIQAMDDAEWFYIKSIIHYVRSEISKRNKPPVQQMESKEGVSYTTPNPQDIQDYTKSLQANQEALVAQSLRIAFREEYKYAMSGIPTTPKYIRSFEEVLNQYNLGNSEEPGDRGDLEYQKWYDKVFSHRNVPRPEYMTFN